MPAQSHIHDEHPADRRHLIFAHADRFEFQQRISPSTIVAVDRRAGDTVVLKTVPTGGISSGARMRLEYESLRLLDIKSPWLVTPREILRAADAITIVAPHAAGTS